MGENLRECAQNTITKVVTSESTGWLRGREGLSEDRAHKRTSPMGDGRDGVVFAEGKPEGRLFEEIRGTQSGEIDTPTGGNEHYQPREGNGEGGAGLRRVWFRHGEISLYR